MREHARSARNRAKDSTEVRNTVRHGNVADAFAGQGERLAVGIADKRILIVFRNIRNRVALEGNLPIRFIRNDKDWMTVCLLLLAQDLRQRLLWRRAAV